VWPTNAAEHWTYLQSKPPQEHAGSNQRLLALVVSSDRDVQESVRGRWQALGHTIVCAPDLESARAIVRQASPHFLIADLGAGELEALRSHLAPITSVIELDRAAGAGDLAMALDHDQAR
jgi:hypothetical protein